MKYLIIIIAIITVSGCATTPRPWTTEEKIMLGASWLAATADYYTTTKLLNAGGYEVNPAMSGHPSNEKVIVVMGISQIANTVLAHYWEAYRIWLLRLKTFVNGGCAVWNANQY